MDEKTPLNEEWFSPCLKLVDLSPAPAWTWFGYKAVRGHIYKYIDEKERNECQWIYFNRKSQFDEYVEALFVSKGANRIFVPVRKTGKNTYEFDVSRMMSKKGWSRNCSAK